MTDCTILARPQPFGDWVRATAPAGKTIRQLLGDAAYSASVSIGGHDVPEQLWDRVKPKPGTEIRIIVYPQGGNGGKILRTVALIALTVFTGGVASGAYLAGVSVAGMSGAVLAAAVGIVGSLAINALIPPPSLSIGNAGAQDPFNQLASLTGTQNNANPNGVIPCVLGAKRYCPPHAALPYTEILGDQQFLRMLLDLGRGDLDVSDIEIGGTAIESFDDVEYEISTNPVLFSNDVYELGVGTALNTTGANDIRTTQGVTDEISVDVRCDNGLVGIDAAGKTVVGTINVSILYRAVGDTTWLTPTDGLTYSSSAISAISGSSDFALKGGARKLLRAGVRWKVPVGQYEVRVGRDTTSWAGTTAQSFSDMAWTVLRSIHSVNPSTTGTLKLALRFNATDRLSGSVPPISVLGAQKVRRWDADTEEWLAPVATQNPAWVALWLQTECPATVRRLADSRMDITAYAEWAAECEDKGYTVCNVADSPRAFGDVLRDVMACGRGAWGIRNGKYSVTRDVAQDIPAQTFAEANSWGFGYSRSFIAPPHALRVKFLNPQAAYQEDVRTVYWDGYDAESATRFEDLDLRMVDDPDAVWKLARYHLSVMWLRQTQYVLNVDFEHLVCEVGNYVDVANRLTAWGVSSGRLRAGGSTVTLEGPVTLEAGKTYKLQIRTSANEREEATITSAAGTHTALTLDAPIGEVGDLYLVGEVNKGLAQLLVRRIERSGDMSAKLTLVDYAPAVLTADAGTPPAFVSEITGTSWCAPPDPPAVHIRLGDSAPDDSGTIYPETGVSGQPTSGIHRAPIYRDKYGGGEI